MKIKRVFDFAIENYSIIYPGYKLIFPGYINSQYGLKLDSSFSFSLTHSPTSMNSSHRRLSTIAGHLLKERGKSGEEGGGDGGVSVAATWTCGIIGYVGRKDAAFPFLMEGLEVLQNRGYDSAGVTTIHDGKLRTTKYASTGSTSNAISRLGKMGSVHKDSTIGDEHFSCLLLLLSIYIKSYFLPFLNRFPLVS